MVDGNACARLETEPVSVAVHVRQMPDRTAAVALLDPCWLRADSSLTLKPGREMLEPRSPMQAWQCPVSAAHGARRHRGAPPRVPSGRPRRGARGADPAGRTAPLKVRST